MRKGKSFQQKIVKQLYGDEVGGGGITCVTSQHKQIKLTWIMDLNVKSKAINLLDNNRGENICDFRFVWVFEDTKSMNHKKKRR